MEGGIHNGAVDPAIMEEVDVVKNSLREESFCCCNAATTAVVVVTHEMKTSVNPCILLSLVLEIANRNRSTTVLGNDE